MTEETTDSTQIRDKQRNKGYHQLSPGVVCQSASVLRCAISGTPPRGKCQNYVLFMGSELWPRKSWDGTRSWGATSLCNFFESLQHSKMEEHKEKMSKRRGTWIHSHSSRGGVEPAASSPCGLSGPRASGSCFLEGCRFC